MFKEKIWWAFVKRHFRRIIVIVMLGLLSSYFTLLLPLSIGKYLEITLGAGAGKTKALQLLGINLPSNLLFFFIFFFGILLVKFFVSWMHQYLSALCGEYFIAGLRERLFRIHLLQKVNGAVQPPSLLSYATESKALQQLLVKGVIGLVKDILFLVMSLYVLCSLNVRLSLVVVFCLMLFWVIQKWVSNKHELVYSEKRKLQGSLLDFVTRVLTGSTYENSNAHSEFEKKSTKLKLAQKKYCLKKNMHRALAPFMLYCMLALVMVFVAMEVNSSQQQTPDVIAYILLLMTMFPTLRNIIKIEYVWMQGRLAAKKINKVMDGSAEPGTAGKNENELTLLAAE